MKSWAKIRRVDSMKRTIIPLVLFAATVTTALAYSKPNNYNEDTERIVIQDEYLYSPHSWVIKKAIDFLATSGFQAEHDLASKYLLPMIEGVTFNDVWGDADLAGASVLDYYSPNAPELNYGFGCALDSASFAPYKDCTSSFKSHPLYGYENAAEHSQFRYDYGKRIYLGHWGDDPRDRMAGWVVDTTFGQDDPQDGRWAEETAGIDSATAPDGTHSSFGLGQTPATAMQDLYENNTSTQVVFPDQGDDLLSTIHVPPQRVLDAGPGWLSARFGPFTADPIEAYMGWDGHEHAVYANWTEDAGGTCHDNHECDGAMVVRMPVGSKAHAFFQLGWAIHLLEDNTTPVHTVHKSYITFQVHNDVEKVADLVLTRPEGVNAGVVEDLLPAPSKDQFTLLYDYPPAPPDLDSDAKCAPPILPDPAGDYRDTWWADSLVFTHPDLKGDQVAGDVAHAYTRSAAEIASKYMPFIADCINTEDDRNYPTMGFFTALGLDNAIKATAGLIRRFIEDVDKTAPALTIVQPAATTYPHSGTLTLNYSSATDDESGVKSVTATLDGQTTVGGHGLASGQVINLLVDLPVPGDHTFTVTATDNAGNVAAPSVTFSIVVTAASIMDDVRYFLSTGDIKVNNEANSLLQKLSAGAAYRAAGDCLDANEVYQSFISELIAQTGKKVSASSAAIMIADAQYLIAHCP